MGRKKGTLHISANFEPQIAAPFDSRTVVDTYESLLDSTTFVSTDGNNYLYKGILVSVIADSVEANNGVYTLVNFPHTQEGSWKKLGGGVSGSMPEYSDLVGYLVGDVISYVSPNAEILPAEDPLKTQGLYECIIDAEPGENPETASNKWRYLGKLGETSGGILITEIPGLQTELEDRVRYSDISKNLKVTSDKKVEVDVSYVTVKGYSPAEDIQPEIEEVKINNTIWKTKNEIWTDGGTGIFTSFEDNAGTIPADVDVYGRMYTANAVNRLLQANPGYRLPTRDDCKDTFDIHVFTRYGFNGDIRSANPFVGPEEAWTNSPRYPWGSNVFGNSTALSLVQTSSYMAATPDETSVYRHFRGVNSSAPSVWYWGEYDEELFSNMSFHISWAGNNRSETSYLTISLWEFVFNNFPGYPVCAPVRLVKDI